MQILINKDYHQMT